MEPESIAVAPSEEQGNVSIETEPEVEPAEETTPVEPTEKVTETPAEPVAELYELPDGRKVDAATLSKEWKDNFYPEFTRKSQALAAKEITKPTDPLADPEYAPKTYDELAAQIQNRTLAAIEAREKEKVDQAKAIEIAIDTQLSEIKKTDPILNESALFVHANKYGFRDLKQAHQNMRDMAEMVKKVQTTTVKNIAKRADPVSVTHGATGAVPIPSQFATAQDYLRAIKASGK